MLNKVKDTLELIFLRQYNPEMNLIEELWKWLKFSVIKNVCYYSLLQIGNAIEKFIRNINMAPTHTIDMLCVRM